MEVKASEIKIETTIDMELDNSMPSDNVASDNGGELNKPKIEEKSAEEERVRVELGPKSFGSSIEMFYYFFNFIHHWPLNLDLNTYEHMVLLELLNKGHPEPDKKIGKGVKAFQIRVHPEWKSKCYFIVRNDETTEDFSFRKCVDQILPLPENMQIGGRDSSHGGRGGGRRGGGRGRGGHFRGGRGRGGKRN